jgi:hypothetical protein
MKTLLATLILATLCAFSGYGQTIKSLGYNTTNGVVVYTNTNTLNFINPVFFGSLAQGELSLDTSFEDDGLGLSIRRGTNDGIFLLNLGFTNNTIHFFVPISFQNNTAAATTRTNLGLPLPALTNTSNADFRTAIGLGSAATNATADFQPASANLTNLASNNAANLTNFPALLLRTNGSAANLTNFPTLNQNTTGTASNVTGVVAIANGGTGATNASNARTALGLGETNNVTFSNITANGTLTVGSIATTAPVSWALDAVQTAAGTNGVLDLPLTANVLRITNANTISAITNGRLGAFYFLLNQSGTNLVISNSATITARGATNLTLGANQSATLISTTTTNATVH